MSNELINLIDLFLSNGFTVKVLDCNNVIATDGMVTVPVYIHTGSSSSYIYCCKAVDEPEEDIMDLFLNSKHHDKDIGTWVFYNTNIERSEKLFVCNHDHSLAEIRSNIQIYKNDQIK